MTTVNEKVYIHEFIDIIGQNRAKYMHHMLANWSPIGQKERHQLCFGVFGDGGLRRGAGPRSSTSGSTTASTGSPDTFDHELTTPPCRTQARRVVGRSGELPQPAATTGSRAGAVDADDQQLCGDGVHGEVFADEM